ncbi:MAG: multicopper oxidase family protein, partial [Bacteroidales bacterium]
KSNEENRKSSSEFEPDVDIELTATPRQIQLLPGEKTKVYSYESKLIKGEDDNLEQLSNTYLGPIIKVEPGQKIRVRFKNQLPDESIIHWHGLHISPEMDGHPMYAINKGEEYVYEFTVNNRPGTYWFHPHPDQITGPQVYYGLAGMFIVEGEKTDIPSGEFDMPLVLQDRILDSDNQLVYLDNSRMARMRGFLGDEMFVNGKADREMEVKKGAYRFRVLNGSNSRIYKLAWNDGSDIIAIGTDGGLLEEPVARPYIMLAPGERVDVWKDFSGIDEGEEVILKSLPFEPGTNIGMGGMMGGGMQSARGAENGVEIDLFAFSVTNEQGYQNELPAQLSEVEKINESEAVNTNSPRRFHFTFERMQWVINGETFGMREVADWEKVKLNTTEIWEFINGNNGGGMGMMNNMMQMPHPVHLHGLQFQIIGRDISEIDPSAWETVKDGFIDEGWQDTFLLLPGMKAKVIMRFRDFTGMYVYHCHNLEHEDMGMMRNYEVVE